MRDQGDQGDIGPAGKGGGGSVFVGFGNRSVVALETGSGVLRWKQLVRGDFSSTSAPAFSAGALFVADPTELRPYGLERIAERVGCDLERYHQDMSMAMKRVAGDVHEAQDAGIHALPTLYIGLQPVVGTVSAGDLLAALDHAST